MNFIALLLPFRLFFRRQILRENFVSKVFIWAGVIIRKGRGNHVVAHGLTPEMATRCRIKLSGSDNMVEIGNVCIKNRLRISVGGSGNRVVLHDGVRIDDVLSIEMWKECSAGSVVVGENSTFWEAVIRNFDSGSSVTIGEDCMFSKGVVVTNTDEHAIMQNGKVINCGRRLIVGNHVWVGQGASLMKNVTIPDGCIVARNAVVCNTRTDVPKNSVLAGIPAGVVKSDIVWSRKSVNDLPGR